MKKSILKKIFAVFIAGIAAAGLCLSVAALNKASKTEKTTEATTSGKTAEEIEADKELIRAYMAGTCQDVDIIPYTDKGEQRYFVVCLRWHTEITVFKVVDGEVKKVDGRRLKTA